MISAVRIGLGVLGAGLAMFGLAMVATGSPVGLWPMVLGAVGIGVAVFEQARYAGRQSGADAQAGLRRTDEVFVDPTTGQRTRVWVDPASGEREYRPDG